MSLWLKAKLDPGHAQALELKRIQAIDLTLATISESSEPLNWFRVWSQINQKHRGRFNQSEIRRVIDLLESQNKIIALPGKTAKYRKAS